MYNQSKYRLAEYYRAELSELYAVLENIMPTPQCVNVLLFDAFSNHCLANVIEPLRAANTLSRRRLYTWQIFTPNGRAVSSSSGLQITPDACVSEARGDVLMVMPSYGFLKHATWDVARQLRSARRRHKTIAGLDTGSWLLADAGLLEGYKATIHWEELITFSEFFPDVDVVRERYVIDRDRITCSGAMAAYELVTHLIELSHGPFLAMEVSQLFMALGDGASAPGLKSPTTRLVQRAISIMQETVENPLAQTEIAKRLGCSQRDLEQKMKGEMAASPQSVYRRLRLTQARKLVLETDQNITEISGRCGYENASAMTRAFRCEFGVTPRDMRRRNEKADQGIP